MTVLPPEGRPDLQHDDSMVWVWDLYPLAVGACENARIREGEPLELREQRRDPPKFRLSAGEYVEGPARPVRRKAYRPIPDDLEILRRAFPDDDPENPSWPNVQAVLVAGGVDPAMLREANAPTLVRLLGRTRDDDEAPAENAGAAAEDALPERVITAREQYLQACEAAGQDEMKDRAAYDLLQMVYEREGGPSPLPSFGTWQRYLRDWRKAAGRQKNRRRDARIGDVHSRIGGSIVPASAINDTRGGGDDD